MTDNCKAPQSFKDAVTASYLKEIEFGDRDRVIDGLLNNPLFTFDPDKIVILTQRIDELARGINVSTWPNIQDRVNTIGFNPVEIADFTIDTYFDEDRSIEIVEGQPYFNNPDNDNLNDEGQKYFNLLDDYLGEALRIATTFADMISQLGGKNGAAQASQILNSLGGMIDKISKNNMEISDNVFSKTMDQLGGSFGPYAQMLIKNLHKTKQTYNEGAIESLKTGLEKFMSRLIGQFENVGPNELMLIMFRMCQLAEQIAQFLQNPLEEFKGIAERAVRTNNVLARQTDERYFEMRQKGLNQERMGTMIEQRPAAASNVNSRRGFISTQGGVNLPVPGFDSDNPLAAPIDTATDLGFSDSGNIYGDINPVFVPPTKEEMKAAGLVSASGGSGYTLTPGVTDMGRRSREHYESVGKDNPEWAKHYDPSKNQDDSGYALVKPRVWAALEKMSSILGTKFQVNSAYRSQYYNQVYMVHVRKNPRVSKTSRHMSGLALDIAKTGFSQSQFIDAARQAGFTTILPENSYIHIEMKETG